MVYKGGVKGYRLWGPEAKKIVINRDVVFDEDLMLTTFHTDLEAQNLKDTSVEKKTWV